MKVACFITFSKWGDNPSSSVKTTKAARGFVLLTKNSGKKKDAIYELQFVVERGKNTQKFKVDEENMPRITTNITDNKKCSFMFGGPQQLMVLVNSFDPSDLHELLRILRNIRDGTPVDVTNYEITAADFKPKNIEVEFKRQYDRAVQQFSKFTESLKITGISMKNADSRWLKCTNLKTLILSDNLLGTSAQQDKLRSVLNQMDSLTSLDLSYCKLNKTGVNDRVQLFKYFPKLLVRLNLKGNNLNTFPEIYHLQHLKYLDLSSNKIQFVPSRVLLLRKLVDFNVSDNWLRFLPYMVKDSIDRLPDLQNVRISGNDMVKMRDEPSVQFYTLPHPFNVPFSRGEVDTLQTIAAFACHSNEKVFRTAARTLPFKVQMDYMHYSDERAGFTSLDFCTNCNRIAHMRYAQVIMCPTTRLGLSIDLVRRDVRMVYTHCAKCAIRQLHTVLPTWKNYWKGYLEDEDDARYAHRRQVFERMELMRTVGDAVNEEEAERQVLAERMEDEDEDEEEEVEENA